MHHYYRRNRRVTVMPKLNYLLTGVGTLIGTIAVDVVAAAGGALLLWNGGGQTVADAPWQTYAILIIGTALLVATRLLLRRRHQLRMLPSTSLLPAVAVAVELGIAALLTVWWLVSNSYLVGWVLTYSCAMLLVNGIFDIFTAVSHRIRPTAIPTGWLRDGVFVSEAIAGVIGAFVTAPIHLWRLPVLDTTLLTIATALAAGMAFAWLLTSTANRTSAAPEAHATPMPTRRRDLINHRSPNTR
jgi:hypothetical protein